MIRILPVVGILLLVVLHAVLPVEVSAAPPQAKAESKAVLDLNSATGAELKSIPGIGDAYAAAILKGRPYKRKDELVDRKILPRGVYEKIKDRLVARQK